MTKDHSAGELTEAAQGTRYLGALGLLAECSVYVPEDIREMIEQAFADACEGDPGLRWKRILNRVEIEVDMRVSKVASHKTIGPNER